MVSVWVVQAAGKKKGQQGEEEVAVAVVIMGHAAAAVEVAVVPHMRVQPCQLCMRL